MTSDRTAANDPVVLRSVPISARGRRFAFGLLVAVALLGVTALALRIEWRPQSYLPAVWPTLMSLFFALQLRGHRLELHADELVLRGPVLVRRVAYRDITAVRGDAPNRIEWSTVLVLERRSGRPINLPALGRPLVEVRDLISQRLVPSARTDLEG